VIGYFNSCQDDALRDELHHAHIYDLDENASGPSAGEIVNQDWLHEWKKHWKPTTIRRL
jgi:ribosomal protein L11 methylase PrmA